MNQGIFTVIDGEGHTTPERPRLRLIRRGVPDGDSSETSEETQAENGFEVTIFKPEAVKIPGKILTVDMPRLDTTDFTNRVLYEKTHPGHSGHPSERPHEEPDRSKRLSFHFPWNKKPRP